MRKIRMTGFLVAVLAAALWIGACSDDDPVDPAGPTDKTPPQVVATDPSGGETNLDLDETIHFIFSEAMDPDTGDGDVTLSMGTVTSAVWVEDRVLEVEHTDWPEGTEITATVGTGVTDVAGNALAEAFSVSFWTETPGQLLLLDTTPADGATDVNRDGGILLLFSQDVNTSTISANVTVTDDPIAKATYGYSVDQIESGLVLLSLDDTLPADTEILVIVGAGVATWGGTTLGTTQVNSFTTGTDVDTTPPTVVSTDPANGDMAMAADQGYFRMNFSEPVNPDTIEPSSWSLAFYFMMITSTVEPVFSEGGSVLTIPLPSDLPAGLPMEVTFVEFEDLAGNIQTTPYTWEAKVAGTTDYVPVVDGAQFLINGEWAEGVIGDENPTDGGYEEYLQQLEVQSGQTFRMVDYDDPSFTLPRDWEEYRKTSSALQWMGFYEAPESMPPVPAKEVFDGPLTILPLPIAVGTWTDNTTVTIDEGGEDVQYRATVSGRVVGQDDYPIAESRGMVFIKDAWLVLRDLEVEYFDGEDWLPAISQQDSVWYGPSQGDVHVVTYEESLDENRWYQSSMWRFPWLEEMMNKSATSFPDPFEER